MEYITPNRFDLIAKYLYIKYYNKEYKSKFYLDLYKNHIEVFNKSWEYPGTKKNIEDFLNSFDKLIKSLRDNGYNKDFPIIIGKNGVIINGVHRLMICKYYNIKPIIQLSDKNGCETYHYDFFLNRNNYWRRDNEIYQNLDRIYTDTMALEYVKIKNNIRSIVFYPIIYNKIGVNGKQINSLISNYGYLYYKKTIKLSKNGFRNLLKEMYRGEGWIGGLFPNNYHCREKLDVCYHDSPVEFYLVEFKDIGNIVEFKSKLRDIFKIGKHSVHIPDNQIDTFRISSSLLNNNSIHFLNNSNINSVSPRFTSLIQYFNKLKQSNVDFCITSSIILEMYSLRDAKDIDYLHRDNMEININNFGCHKGSWLNYYHIPKEEIIYNPKYHFYFNGFKFASLDVIKQMKIKRNEEKDKMDVKLITAKINNII